MGIEQAARRMLTRAACAAVIGVVLIAGIPRAAALDLLDVPTDAADVPDPVETVEEVVEAAVDVVEPVVDVVTESVAPAPTPSPSASPSPAPSPKPSPSPAPASAADGPDPEPDGAREVGVPPDLPARVEPHRQEPPLPVGSPADTMPVPVTPTMAGAAASIGPVDTVPSLAYKGLLTGTPALQPVVLPAPLPALAGGRSTEQVLDVLERIGATQGTVSRILAPFPVAGRATYQADGSRARINTVADTPVIASAAGRILELAGGRARLVGADGTTYTYEGLARSNRLLEEGRAVRKGAVLGFTGGSAPHVVFGLANSGGQAADVLAYLDRWVAEALEAAEALAEAHDGVYAPQVAPAEVAASETLLERPLPVQAGFAPPLGSDLASHDGPAALVPLLLVCGVALLLRRALRKEQTPVTSQGFLDLHGAGG